MYEQPEKYEVLRDNWFKKQSRTIGKFYKVFESMADQQRLELMDDVGNLLEYKESKQ
jgi:hypothetical protein